MNASDTPNAGLGRRGLFAGLAAGLGLAAVAAGARKVQAKLSTRVKGPVLYQRGGEAERYRKSLY